MTTQSTISTSSTRDTILCVQLEKATDGISVKEAAEQLGVTVQTIHNWIRTGGLPATRFGPLVGRGSIVRIDPEDLAKMRGPA